MSKCVWMFASLVGFLPVGSVQAKTAEDAGATASPRWLSSWEEGCKAARASGRPLFVVFRCEH
jgi:hypothetical protein